MKNREKIEKKLSDLKFIRILLLSFLLLLLWDMMLKSLHFLILGDLDLQHMTFMIFRYPLYKSNLIQFMILGICLSKIHFNFQRMNPSEQKQFLSNKKTLVVFSIIFILIALIPVFITGGILLFFPYYLIMGLLGLGFFASIKWIQAYENYLITD